MRFFLPSNDKRNEFISHARDRYYRVILRGDRLNEEVSSVLYCLGAVRNRVDDKIYIVAVYREWNFPRRELNWNDGFRNRSFVRRFFFFSFALWHFEILKYRGEFWYTFIHESIITSRIENYRELKNIWVWNVKGRGDIELIFSKQSCIFSYF